MNLPRDLSGSSPILSLLVRIPGLPDLALVGGAVRDALLKRPHPDLDFCVAGDPRPVARALQGRLGGSWYVLDPVFDVVRFSPRRPAGESGAIVSVDLARRQGDSWQADLERRDLSINAIALPLTQDGQPIADLELLDPTGGLEDLAAGIVRALSPSALEADPVRLMRVFRFAATLGFAVDAQTRSWVSGLAARVWQSAPERIRDELFKLLAARGSASQIADMAQIGLIEILLPELSWLRGTASVGHFDGFAHKLETLRALDELVGQLVQWAPDSARRVEDHLTEPIAADRPRRALMALGALAGDLDALDPEAMPSHAVAERLALRFKLATREMRWLQASQRGRGRFDDLIGDRSRGAPLYRYFRDSDDAAIAVALWALAEHQASRDLTLLGADDGPWAAARAVLAEWVSPTITAPAAPLIRGDELMTILGLDPGPDIARLLEAIAEARADGQICSRVEALDLARTHLSG